MIYRRELMFASAHLLNFVCVCSAAALHFELIESGRVLQKIFKKCDVGGKDLAKKIWLRRLRELFHQRLGEFGLFSLRRRAKEVLLEEQTLSFV